MRRLIDYLNSIINPWEEYSFDSSHGVKEKLRVCLKKLYFWSQREYLIRYLPILKFLRSKPENYTILEVGSGVLGISRYTKRKIVGIDIHTQGPHYGNMKLIQSKAWDLPFENSSFDLVISVDMLEHIPREYRPKVVSELIRVSKEAVIMEFPCGDVSEQWENKVRTVYHQAAEQLADHPEEKERFKKRNSFLMEHEEFVIPKEKEVADYIQNSGQSYEQFKMTGNESLYVWYWGVLGDMKYSYLRWFLTTVFFIIFFPVLSRVSWGGAYRKVFTIKKGKAQ